MARWTCPRCDREFGRANQSHVCVPGRTVDATFAGRPAEFRAIADAIIDHVRSLGSVHVDAVGVGVFVKHSRTLVEIRPQARSVTAWLTLGHFLDDARVTRQIRASSTRFVSVLKLTTVDLVDDQFRDWLTEAYGYAE